MVDSSRNVKFEGATLIFRNFEGRESAYNAKGNREFSVVLDEQQAEELLALGWNVRRTRERQGDDDEILGNDPYLTVSVSFKNVPPRVVMIAGEVPTHLNEDTIELLDHADFANVDLIINPYDWEVGGKTGTKAYLKTLFVTLHEDELERKYRING